MPKIVSRSAISTSEDKQALHSTSRLVVNYCLCGEFILVIDKPLSLLPRRPTDASYVIRNTAPSKRSYKLNTDVAPKPILISRALTNNSHSNNLHAAANTCAFEKQWRHACSRCQLPIGYQTVAPPQVPDWTYIFPGSLTETQSSVPPSALDINPVEKLYAKQQIEEPPEKNSS
ncbi:hypothetical protein PCANC_15629 [Puccinia coronata f. sp. avenae]|uniref:STEEP1 domain-containing protein n=1 Tax=Puccinia coronata f. sp. avenae TaxID=200324 RepID=A0A2N5V2T7_9BASI|nr:hypothetical protein PCANC_15629 [Puccinia coronata f. sp. avenae]PLW14456.1 hypothetical protein PCASD_14376 [Puccinia coronata f. sp. avenae]PLW44293.1 hypothetical protein PCASD_03879 [Puccinia coronata f. sp. avenae]